MTKKRVVVAMSGGVDSAVAAYLLKKQGYDVTGIFMHLWQPSILNKEPRKNLGCNIESLQRARKIAKKLGIPFYIFNFKKPFKKIIVNNFIDGLEKGNTPNPCIICNRLIKFDLLLKKVKTIFKADYLATGHYARLKDSVNGKILLKAEDKKKDQSYFLYNIKQRVLKSVIFPIGNLQKSRVYELAKKLQLPIAKRESQDICFVGKDPGLFLKKYLKNQCGLIKDIDSKKILGQHYGLSLYTIGQRSGIGVSGGPFYVVIKEKKNNVLWVTNNQHHNKLFKTKISLNKINWISAKPKLPIKALVKIRYRDQGNIAKIIKHKKGMRVLFNNPQRAATPGQSAVFYQKEKLLGGGVISNKTY